MDTPPTAAKGSTWVFTTTEVWLLETDTLEDKT